MKVTIDGQEIEVEPGTTILQAARMIGGESVPPAMCYYSKLKGTGGKCRCCLVDVTKGSEADPRPMPKLVASCVTGCQDGMEVAKQIFGKSYRSKKIGNRIFIDKPSVRLSCL
jgi:NADH-quinone oxidoreductase subunit G